ncbi:MGMT family protein [Halodesulfurarchaeum formicicum]|nr:MGMT family protein [Halodesulfurarchaeum formicicum]
MPGAGIYARKMASLDRFVQIGVANRRVISLSVPETPDPSAKADHEILDWIEGYLDGEHTDVTEIDVGLTVPTDQRAVLERVREIPYGEQFPLDRLVAHTPGLDPAEEADLETARTALAENPVPILIPDHRVTDSDGNAPPAIRRTLRRIEGLD